MNLHQRYAFWSLFQFLIETRHRALVSVAAGNPDLEQQHARQSKTRPASAPVTRTESDTAQLSAGETHSYETAAAATERGRQRPHTSKPRIVQQIEQELAQSAAEDVVGQSTAAAGADRQTAAMASRGVAANETVTDDTYMFNAGFQSSPPS